MTKLPADAKVVPLVEQLRRIPKDARLTYEYSPTSHGMFPVGLLAQEAADRIAALEQSDAEQGEALHIVFDGSPGHESGRFVECETPDGKSVNAGKWHERSDGLWELRIAHTPTGR
jgi:hypothetical protein